MLGGTFFFSATMNDFRRQGSSPVPRAAPLSPMARRGLARSAQRSLGHSTPASRLSQKRAAIAANLDAACGGIELHAQRGLDPARFLKRARIR